MEAKEYLPIGSVVLLRNAVKKLMIIGIMQETKTEGKEVKKYDYIGVTYPEGFLMPETMLLFDAENINDVIFRGYDNPERTDFMVKLEETNNKGNKVAGE